ncbi:MAG: glycosyltransferase family 87 protein [Acidobacteriota bacterium]
MTAALCWNTLLADAMAGRLHMNDFGKFYYSARAFLDGQDMYAPSPATDLRFEKAPGLQLLNMNPPHFHLVLLPLARLAPESALTIWMAANLMALVLSLQLIARELRIVWTPERLLLVGLGASIFSGTQAFFGTGQLSLLLLLAVTVAWIQARRGQWVTTAIWLGAAMSVKPFLAIFLPYWLGTRRFRALGAALLAAAACFGIGLVVFGVRAYAGWYAALRQSGDWAWAAMNASTFGLFRRVFSDTPYYAPAVLAPGLLWAWIVPAGLIGVLSLWLAVTDTTREATDRAFCLLLVAAHLVSPLGWVYYMWLPAGPATALIVREMSGHERGLAAKGLAAVTIAGCCWPITWGYLFQPHAWATVWVGSMYFWSALAGWGWLLLDGAHVRYRMGAKHAC